MISKTQVQFLVSISFNDHPKHQQNVRETLEQIRNYLEQEIPASKGVHDVIIERRPGSQDILCGCPLCVVQRKR